MRQFKLALVLSGLLLGSSATAGVPDWTMSESSGQVTVASSGMVRAASRGATLSAGDVITTGPKGRAVIVRGQEYLVVASNSRIRVADPTKSGGMTQIIEQIGNVVFKIRKMATPHFAVETPFLAAVVKGTTFSVTVTETGASVQVIEGRVEVETRDGGARYLVLPGDIGSVSGKALGRLNVQGRETKTLVSPNEGGTVAAPTAEILQADPVATVEPSSPIVLASAVAEPPVRLALATDGMVTGALMAVAATAPERSASLGPASPALPVEPSGAPAAAMPPAEPAAALTPASTVAEPVAAASTPEAAAPAVPVSPLPEPVVVASAPEAAAPPAPTSALSEPVAAVSVQEAATPPAPPSPPIELAGMPAANAAPDGNGGNGASGGRGHGHDYRAGDDDSGRRGRGHSDRGRNGSGSEGSGGGRRNGRPG